ncbi:MAG: proline--tRNA ligase [Candidatus Omnitrophota bacterium]
MRWSNSFIQTQKETPSEAEALSHQLMIRAGLIRPLASGTYSYLPLGLRVLQKVEAIIREEMNREGSAEVLLPALQPAELWQATGRYEVLGKDMISFKDRHGKLNVLGPTHEEVITLLVKGEVKSYRQLPLILYQIQTKFRDEARPRFGVIRSREFIMKDAYSFDVDEKGLAVSYQKMLGAYERIFRRSGLDIFVVEADPGIMGGSRSHEFIVPTENGEEVVGYCGNCRATWPPAGPDKDARQSVGSCPKCRKEGALRRGLEVGHVFELGTKYSAALEAVFLDDQGNRKPILMGCYGIGVNRIVAAAIEQHHDQNGLIWPESIAPFQALVMPLVPDETCTKLATEIYEEGKAEGWELLLDDRVERAGIKFKDADLIGIPYQVIIGQSALKEGKFEIKRRRDGDTRSVSRSEIFETLKKLYGHNPHENAELLCPAKGTEMMEALREAILKILEENSVELVDFIYRRGGPKQVLHILVDTPSGISLDECALLNELIGKMLDEKNLIQESYLLEVASPGLDRPLLTVRDFQRALGKPIRLYLKQSLSGKKEVTGTLEGIHDEKLILRLEKDETIEVSFQDLSKGERVIQF